MRAKFKCENCLNETSINGEGKITLICQFCGCGDIKFDNDIIVEPTSVKNPGDKFNSFLVKKEECFLGYHSLGSLWILSFSIPEVIPEEPLKIRRKGKV